MASQEAQAGDSSNDSRVKLPLLLTARPGNIGVQIDSHRAMNLFSRPRNFKFTSEFHGFMYESGALQNYSRVIERRAQRSRLEQEKLDKLRAREQYLREDAAKRKQKRVQREEARQRWLWQLYQAAKEADEQARENEAAITVQKMIRGALARRVARVLREVKRRNEAAVMLQRVLKTYISRQQVAQKREHRAREEEERREREIHDAATALQRQARKRLQVRHESQPLVACVEENDDENDDEDEENDENDEENDENDELTLRREEAEASMDEKTKAEALERGISLELLFSNEDENDTTSFSLQPHKPSEPPDIERRPRRVLSVKRVGGGYRTTPATVPVL